MKGTLREGAEMPLPRDSAPNKRLISSAFELNTMRAVKQCNTIFSRNLRQYSSNMLPAHSVMASSGAAIRCWLKTMSGIYPTMDYLHRIKKKQSPACPFCPAEYENLVHFMCFCPRFKDARTEAHNRAWKLITDNLVCCLPSDWKLHIETPMFKTGLHMREVIIGEGLNEGRPQNLRMWQPDAVAVSQLRKKIGILDLYRCSDSNPNNLLKAHETKISKYSPLIRALGAYVDDNWTIEILPWVVGIRGFLHHNGIRNAEKFLEIPERDWLSLEKRTVTASIDSLAFMHRVRFSSTSWSGNIHNETFELNAPKPSLGVTHSATSLSSTSALYSRWQNIPLQA
jgi:hypothetical protein